jgi:cinnamyl-alcohol dehydrogenase
MYLDMWVFVQAAAGSVDYIIDTVSAAHPLDPYLSTLKLDGKLVMVGIPEKPSSIHAFSLTSARRYVGGSAIGGIKETQEMLDFCGEHNITCLIEKIPISYINTAMERLDKADVKYRFVIDIANSLKSED